MRLLTAVSVVFLTVVAFGQTETQPVFLAADLHSTPETDIPIQYQRRGPFTGGGHYDFQGATLLDMIVSAYAINPEKVVGGPSWLDYDRFDIHAVTPPNTTPLAAKPMLQSLLADRFKLVVRKEDQPMTAFDLMVGKGKPKLRESSGAGDSGCKQQIEGLPAPGAPGETAAPVNLAARMVTYTCRNMTMQALADEVWNVGASVVGNNPVRDQTNLKGAWDFEFKTSAGRPLGVAASDTISIADAMDKQLGLKLEQVKVPLPVIVVVNASKTLAPNADVPPELEWLANITDPKTRRAYKIDVGEFFAFSIEGRVAEHLER